MVGPSCCWLSKRNQATLGRLQRLEGGCRSSLIAESLARSSATAARFPAACAFPLHTARTVRTWPNWASLAQRRRPTSLPRAWGVPEKAARSLMADPARCAWLASSQAWSGSRTRKTMTTAPDSGQRRRERDSVKARSAHRVHHQARRWTARMIELPRHVGVYQIGRGGADMHCWLVHGWLVHAARKMG